jgi:hypothetical protein
MKILLLNSLLILTIQATSQVTLEINKYDDLEKRRTKETFTSLNVFNRGPESIESISFNVGSVTGPDKTVRYFDLTIISAKNNLGCLNKYYEESKYGGVVLIKLLDGTIIECLQISETDCPKDSADYYWLQARYFPLTRENKYSESQLNILSNNNWNKLSQIPIEKIRIYGSKHYCEYFPNTYFKDFNPQDIFIEHLKALN